MTTALARLRDQPLAALRQENEDLRARVLWYEQMFGAGLSFPRFLGLTPAEGTLLAVFAGPVPQPVSREVLLAALLRHRRNPDDEPELKIIDVYISRLRARLRPFGIRIQTRWGQGYFVDPASQAVLRVLTAVEASASAASPAHREAFHALA